MSLRNAIVTVALIGTSVSSTAFAQEQIVDQRLVSVQERARPGYDPIGIRAGSFMILPTLTVGGRYNDNIYATDTNEIDDFITTVDASVSVESQWSNHALNFSAGLSQDFYASNSDEDRLNWNVGADGRIDVTRDTKLNLAASFARRHEDRGDPNAVASALEPTEYDLTTLSASIDQRFNRITANVGIEYTKYNYKDVPSVLGGSIDQDGRDREEYVENLRLGYDVSPDTNIYVEGKLNQRDYRLQPPFVAFDRNSDGYSAAVGSEFKLTRLIQGGLYVGYQKQEYDSALFQSIDGIGYGANIDWFVTPLTTVNLDAGATIEESTTPGVPGFMRNSVALRVDHELLRNIVLTARGSYASDDYKGSTRKDDIFGAGLGVKYLMGRNIEVGLNYDLTNRDSSINGLDYKRNQVGLTLTGKL